MSYPTEGSEPEFRPSADFHVAEGERRVGLVFVGDSFVNGYGDPKALGWVSRVVARTPHEGVRLTTYNLGVRGDSSTEVLARWQQESDLRWRSANERRLVVGFGAARTGQTVPAASGVTSVVERRHDPTVGRLLELPLYRRARVTRWQPVRHRGAITSNHR